MSKEINEELQEVAIIECETPDNEAIVFWENPENASAELQRKYIGCTKEEWQRPYSFEWEVQEWFSLLESKIKNPFTWEEKAIFYLVKNKESSIESMQEEIDKKVTELKYKALKWNLTTTEKTLLAQLTW